MSSARRFAVASTVGGVAALAVLAVTISQGHLTLLAREPFGNFFDAQARSLLHGDWNVPASEMFIEGFRRNGKIYQYFGVWPALLRMPVLAVSDGLYGRLAQLSMLLGAAVALTGLSLLHWRVRQVLRPAAACGRLEAVIVAATTFCFGCGTAFVFLTSRAWTYHEAIVWGVAWSLLGFERLVAYATEPSGRRLATVSVLTALAFASRASLGLGLAVGLGVLLLVRVVAVARGRTARPAAAWTELGALTVAIVLPVALYAAVNFARFGTPFSVPWTDQLLVTVNPHARQVLAENGGTYFGLKFAPTTLVQYLRPDALAPNALFPWLTFPHFRTPVIGDVRFYTLDPASSIPASMPAATLLAVLGVVALVRPRTLLGAPARALRIALVGAVVGCVPVLAIAYVAQRYLADFLPALALAALVGLQILLRRLRAPTTRPLAVAALAVTAVLAGFGIWANLSLTITYQRLLNPSEPAVRASMIAFQYEVDAHVPGHPHQLVRVRQLPHDVAAAGTTAIVGRCRSVYWSDGRQWMPVEGTPAGGWYRYRARLRSHRLPVPVLTWAGGEMALTAVRQRDDTVFTLTRPGRPPLSGSVRLSRAPFDLGVHVDRRLGHVQVQVGSDTILDAPTRSIPGGAPAAARGPNASLTPLPPHLLVCPAVDRKPAAEDPAGR